MPMVRVTDWALSEINKEVARRKRGSPICHNQKSVVDDMVKAYKEKKENKDA